MYKKLILIILFSLTLFAKEISVFGAGNINSSSPYGLTATEKAILNNSKKIKTLNSKLSQLGVTYDDLSQKIDGIESVYESDSKALNRIRLNNKKFEKAIKQNSINISQNAKLEQLIKNNTIKLAELEEKLTRFIELQEQNNKIVEQTSKDTIALVNIINSSYVSRKQFDELVNFINKQNKIKQKKSSKKHKKGTNVKKRTNKEQLVYAISLYNKQYITKSKPLFLDLIAKKYRPATSNFYVAEICYRKKQYKDAIAHYKASMMLYDQAKYIPTLLLHSAISFEKLKDKDNAINFYSTLIDAYPDTKEAKQASENLAKLQ